MAQYLMWQYKNRNSGEFHVAGNAAARTKMLGKGFADITGQQVWSVPYPVSKTSKQPVVNVPAEVVPESPAETIPAVAEPIAETPAV